jgi:nucleotide-binding universal stress UspA family protein
VARAIALVPRGGVLHLVHILHPHALPGGEFLQAPIDPAFTQAHAHHAASLTTRLRALLPEGAEARGIATHVEVVPHRDPATGILQAAERAGADVICVGTHGGTGRFDTLLGSVSQQVVAHSLRPVLVVPSPRE